MLAEVVGQGGGGGPTEAELVEGFVLDVQRVVIHAGAGADDSLIVELVGACNARQPVERVAPEAAVRGTDAGEGRAAENLKLRGGELRDGVQGVGGLRAGADRQYRVRIKWPDHAIVAVGGAEFVFHAESKVEGKAVGDAPVVLHVGAVVGVAVGLIGVGDGGDGTGQAHHKGRPRSTVVAGAGVARVVGLLCVGGSVAETAGDGARRDAGEELAAGVNSGLMEWWPAMMLKSALLLSTR